MMNSEDSNYEINENGNLFWSSSVLTLIPFTGRKSRISIEEMHFICYFKLQFSFK